MSEQKELPEQPEETEQPEPTENHEHIPAKQASGSSGALFATLISFIAIGAGFWLWQQQRAVSDEVATISQESKQRYDQLSSTVDRLANHNHPESERKLAEIEYLLMQLRSRLSKERNEWMVAEVEHLIRIAGDRLSLEKDAPTAIAALHEAIERLKRLEQSAFNPAIDQINSDIAAITALTLPDRNTMAADLASLSSAVTTWPFAPPVHNPDSDRVSGANSQEEPSPEEDTGVWEDIKAFFAGLVTVRPADEVARPLLTSEQRFFVQQNMRLKLDSARLSLLAGQSMAFHDSLKEAKSWLQAHYDTSSPAVSDALADIERLTAVDLNPEMPTLDKSLELLQRAAMDMPVEQTGPTTSPQSGPGGDTQAPDNKEQSPPNPSPPSGHQEGPAEQSSPADVPTPSEGISL